MRGFSFCARLFGLRACRNALPRMQQRDIWFVIVFGRRRRMDGGHPSRGNESLGSLKLWCITPPCCLNGGIAKEKGGLVANKGRNGHSVLGIRPVLCLSSPPAGRRRKDDARVAAASTV